MRISRLALRPLVALPLLLAAAPAPPLAPGLWEETLVMTMDAVNGSAKMAAQMQPRVPSRPPRRNCRTAADFADPRAIFLTGDDRSCKFDRFVMADGRINAAGDCADGRGVTMHVAGTGRYDTASYSFSFAGTGTVDGLAPNTGETRKLAITFHGTNEARRIGMCPTS